MAMGKFFILLFAVLATNLQAQEMFTFSGKVVNASGEAVEYASIGVPGKNIGTFSATDGTFSLLLPAGFADTLYAGHVSYEAVKIPAAELPGSGEPIIMTERVLGEVVVYDGEKREGRLAGRGMRVAGAATMWDTSNIGCEIGSVVETDRLFEVREVEFRVRSNSIGGARFSVNIYRAVEETGEFLNTLCTPLYIDIPLCSERLDIVASFSENVVIEPGRYFVSIMFVACDETTEASSAGGRIYFPLYMKRSYKRSAIMAGIEECPVNMGLVVRGYEYR